MKRKTFKRIGRIVLVIILLIGAYFLAPVVINLIARPYNLKTYKNRLAEKEKQSPVTYYISPNGNDNNNGKSKEAAWKNISKINETEFNPGDSILLEGSQTFQGNIVFDEHDLGTAGKPIVISSYGGGSSTINAGDGFGIKIINAQGYHISNLNVKGSGQEKNNASGIAVFNNLKGDIKLAYIFIDSVEASGFGFFGILVAGEKGKSGFKNVQIENCNVNNNGDAGLYVYGEYKLNSKAYAHENVFVRNVKAYKNLGRPKSKKNTGSGIVLSDTDNGLIEKCVAYENGILCNAKQGGPVGIWAWDSRNIIIQNNESFNNKTGSVKDGGGFDLDGGMVNSIMQYNYSHDNDGSGFFLAQFTYARTHSGNIVRYNISENDGRKNSHAGIDIWGEVENAIVYNNTIFLSQALKDTPGALMFRPNLESSSPKFPKNIIIANNIFVTKGDVFIVNGIKESPSVKLINNNYYNTDSDFIFKREGKIFSSFEEWRKAAAQQKEENIIDGLTSNPMWQQVTAADSLKGVSKIPFYNLQSSSPLIDKGINMEQVYKIKNVAQDIIGTKLPQQSGFDLGALEFKKN